MRSMPKPFCYAQMIGQIDPPSKAWKFTAI
jgi:hypothetical protein